MDIKIKLTSKTAVSPTYETEGAAGADLYSSEYVIINPGETKLVKTDIALEIPEGYFAMVCPRSGLSLKTGLRQPNSVGIIDSDYRGGINGMFTNTDTSPAIIKPGMRFAQLLIIPVVRANFTVCDKLKDTFRGTGGFGSTGID